MSTEEFDYLTLRRSKDGAVDVLGWGTYPESSVLAGQSMKVFLDSFPDEAAARAAHPQAGEFSSAFTEPRNTFGHLPGPDDMVPGGAYPDDWQ